MSASVEQQVRGVFAKEADKPDLDEDILAYVIACLEDESFEFGNGGEEIYDTVGPMLVCAHCACAICGTTIGSTRARESAAWSRDWNISVKSIICLAVSPQLQC